MDSKRSDVSEKYFSLGQSIVWIYVLTVGPFVVLSWLGFGPFCRPETLHEFGDFLAGVFSPLAFLFFVISVLIQREEFRLTREEMRESRKELENQAVQMQLSAMAPILEKKLEKDLDFINDFLNMDYNYVVKSLDVQNTISFMDNMLSGLEQSLNRVLGQNFVDQSLRNDKMEDIYSRFCRDFDSLYGGLHRTISKKNDIIFYKNTFEILLNLYINSGLIISKEFDYLESAKLIDSKYCLSYSKCLYINNNMSSIEYLSRIISDNERKGLDILQSYREKDF
jgi:hypothetical protein